MPARAFVDSDASLGGGTYGAFESKCPQGHLLILIDKLAEKLDDHDKASKCPRGHLLILIYMVKYDELIEAAGGMSKCPRGHLLILM